jgi:hypothetical protein
LARPLIAYEAVTGNTSEPSESATLRVYEKLRHSLSAFAGVAGFHSLASRALVLAKTEAPSLRGARIAADGALDGLVDSEHQTENDKERAGADPVGGGGAVLIACLLGLLLIFLGEPLTLSLLRVTWPGATFDDSSLVNGRES